MTKPSNGVQCHTCIDLICNMERTCILGINFHLHCQAHFGHARAHTAAAEVCSATAALGDG